MQITFCALLFGFTGKLYMTVWVGVIDDLFVCEMLSFSSDDLRDDDLGFHLLELFHVTQKNLFFPLSLAIHYLLLCMLVQDILDLMIHIIII